MNHFQMHYQTDLIAQRVMIQLPNTLSLKFRLKNIKFFSNQFKDNIN